MVKPADVAHVVHCYYNSGSYNEFLFHEFRQAIFDCSGADGRATCAAHAVKAYPSRRVFENLVVKQTLRLYDGVYRLFVEEVRKMYSAQPWYEEKFDG